MFSIQLELEYWPALIGLVVGGVIAAVLWARMPSRVDRVTVALVLAAGAAHLFLIPAVEPERQMLFGLYGAAMIGVFAFALARIRIWRLGAIGFPLGSILAYFYFAFTAHQADYIGLLVKVVEVATIVAALAPFVAGRRTTPVRRAVE